MPSARSYETVTTKEGAIFLDYGGGWLDWSEVDLVKRRRMGGKLLLGSRKERYTHDIYRFGSM